MLVEQLFEPGVRVTVAMGSNRNLESGKNLRGYFPFCFFHVFSFYIPNEENLLVLSEYARVIPFLSKDGRVMHVLYKF